MSTDSTGAYQEICAKLREVVESPAMATIVGYSPELRYSDVMYAKLPPGNKLWLRFTLAGAREKSRTLGKPSRVTYTGVAGLQLFVPQTDTQAAERSFSVAQLIKQALTGQTANVRFYRAAIKGQAADAQWFYKRIDASAEWTEFQKG